MIVNNLTNRSVSAFLRQSAFLLVMVALAAGVTHRIVNAANSTGMPDRITVILLVCLLAWALAAYRRHYLLYMLLCVMPFYTYFRRMYYAYGLEGIPTMTSAVMDPMLLLPDALLIIAVALAVLNPRWIQEYRRDETYRKIGTALGLFIAVHFLQVFNPALNSVWVGMNGFRLWGFFMLIYYLPVRFFRSATPIAGILSIALITGVISALYGVKQGVLGFTEFERIIVSSGSLGTIWISDKVYRVFSTFPYSTHFAYFMVIAIIASLCLIGMRVRTELKVLALLALPVLAAGLSMSVTRSAWFSLAGGLAFMFGTLTTSNPAARRGRIVLLGLLIVGMLVMNKVSPEPSGGWKSKDYGDALENQLGSLKAPLKDNSMQHRTIQVRASLPYIATHPLGAGVNSQVADKFGAERESVVVENHYFMIAVDLGWLGIAAFLFMIGSVVKYGVRAHDAIRDSSLKWIAKGALGLFVAVMVGNIAGPHMTLHPVDAYMWLLVGSLPVLVKLDRELAADREPAAVATSEATPRA